MSNLFQGEKNSNTAPPRHIMIFALPLFLLLFLGFIFFYVGKNSFMNINEVEVVKVRIAQDDNVVTQKLGEVVLQAVGWAEARPNVTVITALVSGVVERVYIVTGQRVKKGQLLAKIKNEDLFLDFEFAKAKLEELYIELTTQEAYLEIQQLHEVKSDFEKKVALAILERLKHKARSLEKSSVSILKFEKEQAILAVNEQKAKLEQFVVNKRIAISYSQIAKQKMAAIQGKIKSEKVKIKKIKLNISRLRIKAPKSGIIQKVYAREGRKQVFNSEDENSTTIAQMYNPRSLQIRVDVPLREISKVNIGQQVLINIDASKLPFSGKVIGIAGEADYQKNTLQVIVLAKKSPEILRPEMLAQVKFLQNAIAYKKSGGQALFVRKDAVRGGENSYVWVVSLDNRLQKHQVECAGERDDWYIVEKGLYAGQRVVVGGESNFDVGDYVRIGNTYE